jgi:hypothetical protein
MKTVSIALFQAKIMSIRRFVGAYPFVTLEEEILFYKKMCDLSGEKGKLSPKAFKKVVNAELLDIHRFLQKYGWLNDYMEKGKNAADSILFTRNNDDFDEVSIAFDMSLCTTYSYRLAQMLSCDSIKKYLNRELALQVRPESASPKSPFPEVRWEAGGAGITIKWRINCASERSRPLHLWIK